MSELNVISLDDTIGFCPLRINRLDKTVYLKQPLSFPGFCVILFLSICLNAKTSVEMHSYYCGSFVLWYNE